MFFVQKQTSYGSPRARPKITIFYFLAGALSQLAEPRYVRDHRPGRCAGGWLAHCEARSAGSLREAAPTGACLFPLPSRLPQSSFSSPLFGTPPPSLSPPNFPSELLTPNASHLEYVFRTCLNNLNKYMRNPLRHSFTNTNAVDLGMSYDSSDHSLQESSHESHGGAPFRAA